MSEDLPSWILESMSSPFTSSSWGDNTLLLFGRLWGDRGGDRTALLLLRYSVDSNTERGGSQSGSSCDILAKYLRTGALFVSHQEQELFWILYLSPQELAHRCMIEPDVCCRMRIHTWSLRAKENWTEDFLWVVGSGHVCEEIWFRKLYNIFHKGRGFKRISQWR